MKTLFLVFSLLIGTNSFATSTATYQCGPYVLTIHGAEYSDLWDENENHLGHFVGEEEPTFHEGEDLFLTWDEKKHKCEFLGE